MDVEDVIEDCRAEIEQGGFTVAAIVGDGGGCDWAYTIGLHRSFGHPEMLIAGLDAPLGGVILEELGARVASGARIDAAGAVEVELVGTFDLRPHRVDPLWQAQGDWFQLGRAVMASWGLRWPATIQLTWPDATGAHPDRSGDGRWMLRQPLLWSA